MTFRARRTLFIIFIIAFLVITPLVSLYAAGYKIKLSWPFRFSELLQKTGMLVLDTEPNNAKIYINDKPRRLFFKRYYNKEEAFIKTPAKIKNLLPGEYTVKLELDGYWSWEKKLVIKPGQSTYAEDIYLFKKNLPAQIISLVAEEEFSQIPIKIINQSPNKNSFFVANEEKMMILDPNGDIGNEIPSVSKGIRLTSNSSAIWSPNNQKVLVDKNIINSNNNEIINLDKLIGANTNNIKWHKDDDNKLYYQLPYSINEFSLNTKTDNIILNGEKYLDYLINNNYIFFIAETDKTVKLRTATLKNKEIIQEIELPLSPDYKILNQNSEEVKRADQDLLNLYDAKHKILYLINPLSVINPVKEIINNVKYISWVDNKTLLYANDSEIWLYDLETSAKTILTRISQPISNILWHPSDNYIIYSTDKAINIIELDEREKRNMTELIKLDGVYSLHLNNKGDVLYFGAKIGNQEGIYKLEIQ